MADGVDGKRRVARDMSTQSRGVSVGVDGIQLYTTLAREDPAQR